MAENDKSLDEVQWVPSHIVTVGDDSDDEACDCEDGCICCGKWNLDD